MIETWSVVALMIITIGVLARSRFKFLKDSREIEENEEYEETIDIRLSGIINKG